MNTHYKPRTSPSAVQVLQHILNWPGATNEQIAAEVGLQAATISDITRYLSLAELATAVRRSGGGRWAPYEYTLTKAGEEAARTTVPTTKRGPQVRRREFTKQVLIDTLRRHGTLYTHALSELSGVSRTTLQHYLPAMVSTGMLRAERRGQTFYFSVGA